MNEPNPQNQEAGAVAPFVPSELPPLEEAPERPMTEKEAAHALGLPVVSGITVKALSRIGVDANNYGLTTVASGGLICTIQGLVEMQQVLIGIARDPKQKDKTKLEAAVAYSGCARAMHGCATAVNAEGLAAGEKKVQRPKRRLATSAISIAPAA